MQYKIIPTPNGESELYKKYKETRSNNFKNLSPQARKIIEDIPVNPYWVSLVEEITKIEIFLDKLRRNKVDKKYNIIDWILSNDIFYN